jgi:hypothetical protein
MRPEKYSAAIPIGRAVAGTAMVAQDKLPAPPPDNMVKDTPDDPV